MTLDAETNRCLSDVKQGRPRKFVIIAKGERIMSLRVYKKGSLDKYRKLAKGDGKGQFYHGVIDGKGQNICFKLCRGDGFKSSPGTDTKLRQFLAAESEFNFKPSYELVTELPEVSDKDDVPVEAAAEPVASGSLAVSESSFLDPTVFTDSAGILKLSPIVCQFDLVYDGSLDRSLSSDVNRAVAQSKSKANTLINTLLKDVQAKQREESEGNGQAVYEADKLVKQTITKVGESLSDMRRDLRTTAEAAGGQAVQTIGTTMFRTARGITIEKTAFKTQLIDYGFLSGSIKTTKGLIKAVQQCGTWAQKEQQLHQAMAKQLTSLDPPTMPRETEMLIKQCPQYAELVRVLERAVKQMLNREALLGKQMAKADVPERKQLDKHVAAAETAGTGLSELLTARGPLTDELLEALLSDAPQQHPNWQALQTQFTNLPDITSSVDALKRAVLVLCKLLGNLEKKQ